MTTLNPRPIYQQTANPNATNSELDAKVVVSDGRGFDRLTNNEWDVIIDSVSDNNLKNKLRTYRKEDEVVNRLCDTDRSAYKSIPSRF